jgi:pyruvate dehydrogenase E2 component (dihydrolipoamide acetyltransferase)
VEIQGDFVGQILAAETPAELAEALRPLTREPMSLPSEALEGTLTALRRHAASLGRLAKTLTDGGRQRLDLSPVLAGLSVPSRILFGEADAILPWAAFRQPPHIPIHRLACGHMPHWEQLDVVRRLLAFADWQPAAAQYGTGDKQ